MNGFNWILLVVLHCELYTRRPCAGGWALPFTILDAPSPGGVIVRFAKRRRATHAAISTAKYQITRRRIPACTSTAGILLVYTSMRDLYAWVCVLECALPVCGTLLLLHLLPHLVSAASFLFVPLCLCVCVNYLMVCKFAMRCVAAWFQFCGWRKINFVSGLILPLCCIASPVASCQFPVYNFICWRCTALQSVYVICSYCAQLYRKQEAHTNLINLKCMKAVANQHNIMLTHTHTHTQQVNKQVECLQQTESHRERVTEKWG